MIINFIHYLIRSPQATTSTSHHTPKIQQLGGGPRIEVQFKFIVTHTTKQNSFNECMSKIDVCFDSSNLVVFSLKVFGSLMTLLEKR
jgi:hypothetical protein